MSAKKILPIVYSCSGCSTAAQMANYVAVQMDRQEVAEMSCIAGVGGDVKSLVMKAKSALSIIAIDGCSLKCVESCLARHGVKASSHFVLSDFKVSKKFHQDFDPHEAQEILMTVIEKTNKQHD
jgi:uncharacterized metal-binding protein